LDADQEAFPDRLMGLTAAQGRSRAYRGTLTKRSSALRRVDGLADTGRKPSGSFRAFEQPLHGISGGVAEVGESFIALEAVTVSRTPVRKPSGSLMRPTAASRKSRGVAEIGKLFVAVRRVTASRTCQEAFRSSERLTAASRKDSGVSRKSAKRSSAARRVTVSRTPSGRFWVAGVAVGCPSEDPWRIAEVRRIVHTALGG